MKILFLACLNKNESGNTFGGAEKSIVKLTDWISKKRKEDRVILASVQGSENTFLDDCQFEFYGTKQYKGKFVTHLMMLWNTWKIILSVRPNIVVSFWIHPLFYAIPLKMILGFVSGFSFSVIKFDLDIRFISVLLILNFRLSCLS